MGGDVINGLLFNFISRSLPFVAFRHSLFYQPARPPYFEIIAAEGTGRQPVLVEEKFRFLTADTQRSSNP
jgi:hypothetical protein